MPQDTLGRLRQSTLSLPRRFNEPARGQDTGQPRTLELLVYPCLRFVLQGIDSRWPCLLHRMRLRHGPNPRSRDGRSSP